MLLKHTVLKTVCLEHEGKKSPSAAFDIPIILISYLDGLGGGVMCMLVVV